MSMLLAAFLAAGVMAGEALPAPGAPAVAPKPGKAEVMAAVRAEWPHYDKEGSGKLTPLEFATWVIRANGGRVSVRPHDGGIPPVSAMNATATAFMRADVDHDGGVTPDEMVRFLMLPPQPQPMTKPHPAPVKAAPTPVTPAAH